MSPIPHPPATGEVAVHLLDPNFGRPVQSWKFVDQRQITIGRAPDQDVSIPDPYVSRNHANLVFRDNQWLLVSLGRNGVVVGDQLITEQPVRGEVSFRLGMEGPTLRFRTTAEQADIVATICFDTLPAPVIQLDESKLKSDVNQIADGDYFQKLQHQARQLRRRREST